MRTTRTAPALVLLAVLALAGGACAGERPSATRAEPAPTTTTPDVRPTGTVDQLVPVGEDGARLHLRCTGSGTSTVVLASGFEAGDDSWSAVAPAVAREARVCSYDRFGTGESDAPTTDQTFTAQAEDLHELLDAAGEPGPYVVVGHSFGGLEAVAFASRYADEVEGVLLLDTTPPAWPQAVCGVADDGSEAAAGFRQTCAQVSGADNVERLDVPAAFAEVAGITSLGDLPLRVVTRARLTYPGLSAGSEAVLDRAWGAGQQHWASLSSAGHLVPVEDTGHHIQLDQPAVVIGEVLALVHDAGSVTTPEHP